jgi:hypothetical protein
MKHADQPHGASHRGALEHAEDIQHPITLAEQDPTSALVSHPGCNEGVHALRGATAKGATAK